MKIPLAMIGLIALLAIGCSFGGPTNSQDNVIWPLSEGSEWQGTMTYYDLEGNQLSQSPLTFYTLGDTVLENSTWYFFGTYAERNPDVPQSYLLLSNKSDGLHQLFLPIFFRDAGPALPQQLWFKYPTKVGDGYWSGDYDSITVRSVNQLVTAPQGTHRCVIYDYYFEQGYRRYYVAPGVGIVRWEEYLPYDYDFGTDPPETPGWVWELEKLVVK